MPMPKGHKTAKTLGNEHNIKRAAQTKKETFWLKLSNPKILVLKENALPRGAK